MSFAQRPSDAGIDAASDQDTHYPLLGYDEDDPTFSVSIDLSKSRKLSSSASTADALATSIIWRLTNRAES